MLTTANAAKLLNDIADQIERDPTSYDQGTWGDARPDLSVDSDLNEALPTATIEACGTTCCIAGWAATIAAPKNILWSRRTRVKDPLYGFLSYENVVGPAEKAVERLLKDELDPRYYRPTIEGVVLTEKQLDRYEVDPELIRENVGTNARPRYQVSVQDFAASVLNLSRIDADTLFGGSWFPHAFEEKLQAEGTHPGAHELVVAAALRELANNPTATVDSLTFIDDEYDYDPRYDG
jgi:hypothetical protein